MYAQEEPGSPANGLPAAAASLAAGWEHQAQGQHAAHQDPVTSLHLDLMMLDGQQPLPREPAPAEQLLPDTPAAEELSPEEWQQIVVRPTPHHWWSVAMHPLCKAAHGLAIDLQQ